LGSDPLCIAAVFSSSAALEQLQVEPPRAEGGEEDDAAAHHHRHDRVGDAASVEQSRARRGPHHHARRGARLAVYRGASCSGPQKPVPPAILARRLSCILSMRRGGARAEDSRLGSRSARGAPPSKLSVGPTLHLYSRSLRYTRSRSLYPESILREAITRMHPAVVSSVHAITRVAMLAAHGMQHNAIPTMRRSLGLACSLGRRRD